MKDLLTLYIILYRKCFSLDILKALLSYDHIKLQFPNEKKAILKRDANDKSKGI